MGSVECQVFGILNVNLSRDYIRLAADEDEYDRDPELEEEFRARDWPEVSRPLRGGRLRWEQVSDYWHQTGYPMIGPVWRAQATPNIRYEIWSFRKLHEDWRGDYYNYEFIPVVKTKKKQKTRSRTKNEEYELSSNHTLSSTDTLQEAQQECEKHALEHFLE